jgi:tyrosinase
MTVRKNAFKITADEAKAYTDGVTEMIKNGSYAKLVDIHAEMSHNMHTMGSGPRALVGTQRFLQWHRAYLWEMEKELQKASKGAFIPYWDWTDKAGLPAWLVGFTPTVKTPKNGEVVNQRNKLTKPISDKARIDELLKIPNYVKFTQELESDPHNLGHGMLGTPMDIIPTAPCDPIFWMHHAMVDYVWSRWAAKYKGLGPRLTGKDLTLDPWKWNLADVPAVTYV